MKDKLIALLSKVQRFGMAEWDHGLQAVTNSEIADRLIANNVIVQKKDPAPIAFVGRKGYVLTTDNLPQILQDLMDERGLSRRELCLKAGLNQSTLGRCMTEHGGMSHFSLECLFEALGKELVIVDKKESAENGKT